jgi:hypothetical protein
MPKHNDTRTLNEKVRDRIAELLDNVANSELLGTVFSLIVAIAVIGGVIIVILIIGAVIVKAITPDNSATETEVIGQIKTTQNQGLYIHSDYFQVGVKKVDGTSEAFRIYSTDQYPVDPIVLYQSLEPGRWYKFRVWGKPQWNVPRAVYKAELIDPPDLSVIPSVTPTQTSQ